MSSYFRVFHYLGPCHSFHLTCSLSYFGKLMPNEQELSKNPLSLCATKHLLTIKFTHVNDSPSVELHFFSVLRFIKTIITKIITEFKGGIKWKGCASYFFLSKEKEHTYHTCLPKYTSPVFDKITIIVKDTFN